MQSAQGCLEFFSIFFRALEQAGVRYCVLHGWQHLPRLESDLDVVVDPQDRSRLWLAFAALKEEGFEVSQFRNYAVHGYRFEFSHAHASALRLFSVDLIFEYRYAGLILQGGQALLRGRCRQGNMWVASPRSEFTYLLLKKTVKQSISPAQSLRLQELAAELGPAQAKSAATELFGGKWGTRCVEACREAALVSILPRLRVKLWQRRLIRKPFDLLRYAAGDTLRLLRRWIRPTGLLVIVLGPDGVGKNTVISQLQTLLAPAFRFQKMFHWRPGVLWRLKAMGQPVADPHAKPVYGTFLSLVSLLACFLDHWIGYLLVIRPAMTRSALVVFNRYFDDLLVDPVRYRYGGPLWLARLLSRFTPSRGGLFVVLTASPPAILARKQELTYDEVQRQLAEYRRLGGRANARMVATDGPVENVGINAAQIVAQHLGERSLRRYKQLAGLRTGAPGLDRMSMAAPAEHTGLQQALRQFVGGPGAGTLQMRLDERVPSNGHGLRVHRFAALPSAKDARWLISLENSSCARASWRIYAPFKVRAQFLKQVFVHLSGTGWTGWARHPLSISSSELLPIEMLVSEFTGEEQPVFAIALGTPGRFRKLTVQAMRRDGSVLGYLKLALSESADARVRHEAEMLRRLQSSLELRPHLPEVLYAGEWKSGYVLFQSPGPAEPGPVHFGESHREFQSKLEGVAREERLSSSLVEEVEMRFQAVRPLLTADVEAVCGHALRRARQELGERGVLCGVAHGDFAPWNTRRGLAGLYVFDWESARASVPVCWDEFHFRVQVASLLNRKQSLRPLVSNREPGQLGSWLLYLVDSLCRCLENGASKRGEVELRMQLLGAVSR